MSGSCEPAVRMAERDLQMRILLLWGADLGQKSLLT